MFSLVEGWIHEYTTIRAALEKRVPMYFTMSGGLFTTGGPDLEEPEAMSMDFSSPRLC
jgi:hypothetical protein